MKFLVGILLVLHGLIVALQSTGSFGSAPATGIQNPAWVSWWPVNLGRSWLLSLLGLEKAPITWVVGFLWLVGGLLLMAAGLGAMGWVIPVEWWRNLAIAGGAISLLMLVVYLHPLMLAGTLASVAVLVALVWARWPSSTLVP